MKSYIVLPFSVLFCENEMNQQQDKIQVNSWYKKNSKSNIFMLYFNRIGGHHILVLVRLTHWLSSLSEYFCKVDCGIKKHNF